jgi:hypothetical protein
VPFLLLADAVLSKPLSASLLLDAITKIEAESISTDKDWNVQIEPVTG